MKEYEVVKYKCRAECVLSQNEGPDDHYHTLVIEQGCLARPCFRWCPEENESSKCDCLWICDGESRNEDLPTYHWF